MTGEEFRSSPERVAEWRALLAGNTTVAHVLVVLRDEKPTAAVPPGTDVTERVGILGKLEQHEADVNLLLSLAEPLAPEPEQEEMTWGAKPPPK